MAERKFCEMYFRAFESLQEESNGCPDMDLGSAQNRLSATTGLSFRPGTEWADIISHMRSWGWLEMDEQTKRIKLKGLR